MASIIIDNNGVIHSGSEAQMEIAFAAMIENVDFFPTKKDYKLAVKEYKADWTGDLILADVKYRTR